MKIGTWEWNPQISSQKVIIVAYFIWAEVRITLVLFNGKAVLFFLSFMCHLLLLLFSLQQAPVWEITGAEFSKSEMHTADGISIRFPRMTRIRDDKDWKSATNLHQLKVGYHDFDSHLHIKVWLCIGV